MVAGVVAAGGYGAYAYQTGFTPKTFTPTKDDYQKVYDEIAKLLVEKDDYDDGSYGPVSIERLFALGSFFVNGNVNRSLFVWRGIPAARMTRTAGLAAAMEPR